MLNGLTDKLLISHYENNYGGALRRLNAIEARIGTLDWATAPVFEINGTQARGTDRRGLGHPARDLFRLRLAATAVIRPRGLVSPRPWNATSAASPRGQPSSPRWPRRRQADPGWTTLVWSDRLGRLINQWSADHAHALADGAPILALDMYEHAYHLDFGARAAAYVDAVMGNLHWERIAARYRQVRHGEAEDVALFTPFGSPTRSRAC